MKRCQNTLLQTPEWHLTKREKKYRSIISNSIICFDFCQPVCAFTSFNFHINGEALMLNLSPTA
jgi:hypothetical protein